MPFSLHDCGRKNTLHNVAQNRWSLWKLDWSKFLNKTWVVGNVWNYDIWYCICIYILSILIYCLFGSGFFNKWVILNWCSQTCDKGTWNNLKSWFSFGRNFWPSFWPWFFLPCSISGCVISEWLIYNPRHPNTPDRVFGPEKHAKTY